MIPRRYQHSGFSEKDDEGKAAAKQRFGEAAVAALWLLNQAEAQGRLRGSADPTRIQFESNGLSDAGHEKRVIQSLEERGYKDITEHKDAHDKVMIRDLAYDIPESAPTSIENRSSLF